MLFAELGPVWQRFKDSLVHERSSDDLVIEQYRSLRAQVPAMYIAVFINVLFLAGVTSRSVGNAAFYLPCGLSALVAARFCMWWLSEPRAGPPSLAAMRFSMWITVAVAAFVATSLTLWGVYILSAGGDAARLYLALFAALCTISCAACLTSLPLAAYIVVAGGTVPVSLSLMVSGDFVMQSMGANLLLGSPLMVAMIHRQHGQMRRLVASRSDIAARRADMHVLAYRDSLTGLANRRAFLDGLERASKGPSAAQLAVGLLDLNGFKVINDTYGHQVGDALLVESARRFERLVAGDTLVARLGGDEFAILLRDVGSVCEARTRMAGIACAFQQAFLIGLQSFRLTASIGLAHNLDDAEATLDLVNRADLAMFEAKRNRSGSICLFDPGLAARSRRRLTIDQSLINPAETALISLVYQPIIATETGEITGFEALARWTHPTLGEISPTEFITLAEHVGATEPMTARLLSMALRQASSWPAHIGLSFNLSAAELVSPTLSARILALVAEHGFDPRRLSIEVTETALLSDFSAARSGLSALQGGGVRILLDDFGAGYASIGYLREMRFDGIKLDGSLIRTLTISSAARDLLGGVLALCRAIGAPVTAEMIETEAQYDLLRMFGVEKMQGYYLSRPLARDKVLAACTSGRFGPVTRTSSVVPFSRPLAASGAT